MSVPASFTGTGRSVGAEGDVAAHARRQVQNHVHLGLADAVGHLAVEVEPARRLPGLRVAHMAMDDGRAGPGRVDGAFGDLRWGCAARAGFGPGCCPNRSRHR
jgi:hypothetical protein